jgi:hypothetical protein
MIRRSCVAVLLRHGLMLSLALLPARECALAADAPIAMSMQGLGGGPHWVVDPTHPGDDLPPRGRSLFDFLTTEERGDRNLQSVPFPFASLLRRVEAKMRPQSSANTSATVLIPLGRSLQRMAAAPEFMTFPRVVTAAIGETADNGAPLLKDRLYLGYQQKANVLEVISYNEDAGRFEFQIVSDYRTGGTPRVAYANRVLCTACHQNAAPIFSRQVWDETNANPTVAVWLAAQRKDFEGIAIDRGVDVPNAIDDAKLRANRFAVDQLLWRDGCGGNEPLAIRCRAGLFMAVLQYRLSGLQHFDHASAPYRGDAVPRLLGTAAQRWPGGLALGNPDLPNRNPMAGAGPPATTLTPHEWANLANVTPPYDPLPLRPALEVWRITGEDDVARLVRELAEFIAPLDAERLDRELSRRGSHSAAVNAHPAKCRLTASSAEQSRQRIDFSCTPWSSVPAGLSSTGVAMEGHLFMQRGANVVGVIDRLAIEGELALHDLALSGRRFDSGNGQHVAVVTPMRAGLRARGADGEALEQIEFRWSGGNGTASLHVVDDFSIARAAIAALTNDNLNGKFDGFSDAAFRRARLMPAFFSSIGVATSDWCCLDASSLPAPGTSSIGSRGTAAPSHAGFNRYCGQCHLGAEPAPPNFLAGDTFAVETNLKHCAPRIFVRLSMWQRAASVRAKSPMPPEVALHRMELSADAWRDGEPLAALLQSTAERLRTETGRVPDLDGLLHEGYENLRSCLAN